MDSIATAFGLLTNPGSWPGLHTGYTEIQNQESAATRLPIELWQRIAILLTPSSQLCLALSCRHLYKNSSPEALASLQHDLSEKMEFLKLLDESLPNHFLCAGCLIYQRRSDERLEHPHCFREAPLIPRLVNVNFNLVQSHMRASNLGLQYGRKVDDNKTLKKKISPSCHDHPLGYSYRIRSAVLDGHLLLRTDSSKAFQSPMEQDLWNVVQWLAQCTHFYDEVEDICRCALGHARNGNGRIVQCDNCLRPRRCHSCASEYIIRVTARCHPRTEYILSVTRWTDLGNGKIPWYGEWDAASRIGVRRIRRDTVYDLQGLPCVRSRFEGKGSPTGSDVSDKDPEPLYTEPIPLQDIDDGVLPRVVCKIATFDWETRTTVRNKGVPKLLPRPEGDT